VISELRPYPTYKESGVPWLGKLPDHWQVDRLKARVVNVKETAGEGGIGDLRVALECVESWTGRLQQGGTNLFIDSQVKRFHADDVLFGKLRPYLAKVTRPDRAGACVGEFFVLRPREPGLHSSYLEYLLRSKPIIDAIDSSTFGAKMPRANWQFVGNMEMSIPPLVEQSVIVRFLNYVDRRIRRYIRARQKLISLLNEQKQAIIHRAVTRGLDPSVRLKPSGVEWLGDIPAHWERRAVWQLFELGRGKVTSHEYIADHPGPYPVYSSQTESDGVMGHVDTFMFEGDYLTWTTDGAHAGTVFRRSGRFNCTNVCGTLKPRAPVDLAFMQMAVGSETKRQVRLDINPKLMNNMIARIRVSLPPYEEEVLIAQLVQSVTDPSEALTHSIQHEIGLLREYRTRLIADVVTGKLDVREAAAHLPDEPEEPDETEPRDDAQIYQRMMKKAKA
jgi:type I restriction enzyme S subunit